MEHTFYKKTSLRYFFSLLVLWAAACSSPSGSGEWQRADLVDKDWKVTRFELKHQVGILYPNSAELAEGAAAVLSQGLNIRFYSDGSFEWKEGTHIYKGAWKEKNKHLLKCTFAAHPRLKVSEWQQFNIENDHLTAVITFPGAFYALEADAR